MAEGPKVRDVIRRLERDGWLLDRQSGSHRQFKHPTIKGLVTVRCVGNEYPDWNVQEHYEAGGLEAMKYAYVVERGPTSFGAYVPDLPGCVAVGKSYAAVNRMIQRAAQFHIEGLVAAGLPVPKPSSRADELEVDVPSRPRARRTGAVSMLDLFRQTPRRKTIVRAKKVSKRKVTRRRTRR
jgi:predicted RNase H-like HicB family nuclease/predicted RNA binding protein YcfA (HicA-like mRNA interferase family)